jgi:hypothetical protein
VTSSPPNFGCREFSEVRVWGVSEDSSSWENVPIVNRASYVAVFSGVSPQYHG